MGLPIIVGSKLSSTKAIPRSSSSNELWYEDDDEIDFHLEDPIVAHGGGTVTVCAVCSEKELLATVTVHFWRGVPRSASRIGDENGTVLIAEFRVQISPMAKSLSSTFREVLHRVILPPGSHQASEENKGNIPIKASAVFSTSRRHLSCLIPCPSSDSILVIFQLRKPHSLFEKPLHQSPLPSQILKASNESDTPEVSIPVATNPQLLNMQLSQSPHQISAAGRIAPCITAICDSGVLARRQGATKGSMLLAGCNDGSILLISYRPVMVVDKYDGDARSGTDGSSCVSQLAHFAVSGNSEDGLSTGKLVVIKDFSDALIYSTHFSLLEMNVGNNGLFGQDTSERGNPSIHMENNELSEPESTTGRATPITISPNFRKETDVLQQRGSTLSFSDERLSEEILQTRFPSTSEMATEPVQSSNSAPVTISNRSTSSKTLQLSPTPRMDVCRVGKITGDFCVAKWINSVQLALLLSPKQNCDYVAEVWSVGVESDTRGTLDSQLISQLTMTLEDLNENSHLCYSFGQIIDRVEEDLCEEYQAVCSHARMNALQCSSLLSIELDSWSGCLALSSTKIFETVGSHDICDQKIRPFVCLWDWKTNTLGFTAGVKRPIDVRAALWTRLVSHLEFAKTIQQHSFQVGHLLSFVPSALSLEGTFRFQLRKKLYPMGLLSPPSAVMEDSWNIREESSLMLSSKSLAYPSSTFHSTCNTGCEIEWEESLIPSQYISSNGPPSIAAVGKKWGKSIAVASDSGICVHSTTLGRPKWRFFGSETEEKAFRVLALTWWEGDNGKNAGAGSHSEDLLIAIIQLQQLEHSEKQLPCYLACWSQKSLDATHQLLRPVDFQPSSTEKITWGFQLSEEILPISLSLLSQPVGACHDSKRRAVLLVRSRTRGVDSVHDLNFEIFQLEVADALFSGQSVERKQFNVLVQRCLTRGRISQVEGSSLMSVFLATASFNFNLYDKYASSDHKKSSHGDPEFIGVVAVLRCPAVALETFTVMATGNVPSECLISEGIVNRKLHDHVSSDSESFSWVASYWVSDILADPSSSTYFMVWSFLLRDGGIYCWFVPYVGSGFHARINECPVLAEERSDYMEYMIGFILPIRSASTWLQHYGSRTKREYALGSQPGSAFGCSLSTRQGLRRFGTSSDQECLSTQSSSIHEALILGDITLSPPIFSLSMFAIMYSKALSLAKSLPADAATVTEKPYRDYTISLRKYNILRHVESRSEVHQDAAFTVLRLLILRTVDKLANESKKHGSTERVQAGLLAEIIGITKSCTRSLQCASMLLDVGRHLEPSIVNHLFPLPLSRIKDDTATSFDMTEKENLIQEAETVNDLFNICLQEGSPSAAMSSLPLLGTKMDSIKKSWTMFCYCLSKFQKDPGYSCFDSFAEERAALNDLFRFGLKLEDSIFASVQQSGCDNEASESSTIYSTESSTNASEPRGILSLACGLLGRRKRKEIDEIGEKAIEHAASSFIQTGFLNEDEYLYDDLETEPVIPLEYVVPQNSRMMLQYYEFSFCAAVCRLMVKVAFSEDGNVNKFRWKYLASLAEVLLEDEHSQVPMSSCSECVAAVEAFAIEDLANLTVSSEEELELLLSREISHCSEELSVYGAEQIFNLTRLILSRMNVDHDEESLISRLLVIGVTVAHVSNNVSVLLGDSEMLLEKSYRNVVRSLQFLHMMDSSL